MKAVAGSRRRPAVALAAMLLAASVAVPSAVAQGASSAHRTGGADRAGRAPTQHFLILGTDPREHAKPPVVAFGPIHAKGVDVAVNNRKDIFRFPQGNLVVRHKRASGSQHHDPVTCLTRFKERGHYRVVRGTGAYAGAHGHGHYVVHVTFVACRRHQAPEAFVQEIRARGPLHL